MIDHSKLPLVTIGIPAYNQEGYIARAIESALAQTYPALEIIVCDDHSTDGTFAVAQAYGSQAVRVYRNEYNIGRVANYRRCLVELASGDWFVNLDGDDFYDDPHFIERAVEKVGTDADIVMYAGGAKSLNEATGLIETPALGLPVPEKCMSGVDFVLAYPRLNATQHFAVLYNRHLALLTDFYTLDSLGTDTDSLCRLALKGKVFVERRYVGVWTHHGRNASYSLNEEDLVKEVRMLEHIGDALAEHVPQEVARQWVDERVTEKRRFVTILTLSKLPPREAWAYFFQKAKPNLFFAREAVKLVLRSIGLK